MKAISGKQPLKALGGKRLPLMRINGSHHIYLRTSVPAHGETALKIGLQKQIMKMASISDFLLK